eukprot:6213558-Pleurochrysis_carterae.AAC.3
MFALFEMGVTFKQLRTHRAPPCAARKVWTGHEACIHANFNNVLSASRAYAQASVQTQRQTHAQTHAQAHARARRSGRTHIRAHIRAGIHAPTFSSLFPRLCRYYLSVKQQKGVSAEIRSLKREVAELRRGADLVAAQTRARLAHQRQQQQQQSMQQQQQNRQQYGQQQQNGQCAGARYAQHRDVAVVAAFVAVTLSVFPSLTALDVQRHAVSANLPKRQSVHARSQSVQRHAVSANLPKRRSVHAK